MDYGASVCFSCMRGTFADKNGSTACQLSGAGSYVPSTGQTTSTLCAAGTFQFMGGSSTCILCAAGHFQTAAGSTACTACLPGYHQHMKGGNRCIQCSRGKFSWEEGSIACADCESGSFQEWPASTTCSRCEQGHAQAMHGQSHCVVCHEGTFQLAMGSSLCLECPKGAYQNLQGATVCLECLSGKYQAFTGAPHPENCTVCPPGSYSAGIGMTACIHCAAGTHASSTGSTQCTDCRAGTYQSSSAASACLACPRGTQGYDTGVSVEAGCYPCPKGAFGNESGQTACQICPPGKHQPTPYASSCLDCAPGTYMDEQGWEGKACHVCKPGTYSPESGASDEHACAACQQGFFSTMEGADHMQACAMCPRGTFSVASRTGCAACELGTFCPEGSGSQIECRDKNLACNGSHLLAIPGFLAIFDPPDCTGVIPCPPGTQCHAHPAEGDGMMERAIGQTHIVVFENGPNVTQCNCTGKKQMAYGYGRVDWPDYGDPAEGRRILFRLQPEGCLAGSFLKNALCEPCPLGTYSSKKGALDWSDCLACPEGTYSASNGSTICAACAQGSYQDAVGGTLCLSCQPGEFQSSPGTTSCAHCKSGKFVNSSGASICQNCPAGTAQAVSGSKGCDACSPVQFSNTGDSVCTQCWSTPSPETHRLVCPDDVGTLPERVDSIWITTTGADDSDECLGSGVTEKRLSYTGLYEKVFFLGHNLTCKHTMRFMGRPDLTNSWTTTHIQLQKPVRLEVIPHNDTFYPAFCLKHGLSVAFYVQDAEGNSVTNLSDSEAVISFVDPASGDLLYWRVCDRLPRTVWNGSVVAMGYCKTRSFCPGTDVEARVTLSWPGGNSVQGRQVLKAGGWLPCPPSSSWLTYVELVEPDIPFFTDEVMQVRIRMVENPSSIVGFKFQLQLSSGVQFQAISSVFAISHTLDSSVLSVQGENTGMTADQVLCELKLRQGMNDTGLHSILQVIQHSFQVRMEDHMSYEALVRTQGFTCGNELGELIALVDTPRITTIVAEPVRKKLIHWKAIQNAARTFKTSVETVGVWNIPTEESISIVPARCSSYQEDFLLVDSCLHVESRPAWGRGGAGKVLVQAGAASTATTIDVLVPLLTTVEPFSALDGLSGRVKVLVRLTTNGHHVFDAQVDATPHLAMHTPDGAVVKVDNEEWHCINHVQARNFTMGEPPLLHGACTEKTRYKKGLIPFLFTGGYGGAHGFTFNKSIIHPKTSQGVLLLFSSDQGLLWYTLEEDQHISLDAAVDMPGDRISVARDQISLQSHAMSPRCIRLLYPGLPRDPISIAVFPAAPASLHVILSSYVLVTQHDIGDILPSQADIVEAWIMLSNNARYDVAGDQRLQMHTDDDLEVIPAVGVKTRMTGGLFSVVFKMEGMHCLSYSATVRVHPYSIASAQLECPRCPEFLTLEEDPMSKLFPQMFLSSIPVEWFELQCILVDGTQRAKQRIQLIIEGVAEIRDGKVFGMSQGAFQVSTPLARTAFQMQVIQRWAVKAELLCNGVGCVDPGVSLAPPGDGASLSPFGYSTQLTITSKFVLVNHTTFTLQPPSGMILYVNNRETDPNAVPLMGHEQLEILLFIPDEWKIKSTGATIWIHVLDSLLVIGERTLFQVHCSGMWEKGSYSVTGKLSDGSEAEVYPEFATDGDVIRPFGEDGARHTFLPEKEGEGTINVTFGNFVEQFTVIATLSSKYVESVRLDFLPLDWNTPLHTPLQLDPVLEPCFDVKCPTELWQRVLSWSASERGVIMWNPNATSMVLLSDYFQSIAIISDLASCEDAREKPFSKSINVNVVPNQKGQVDLGAEKGPPLPVIAVGKILPIPVYMFSDTKLFAYKIQAQFENVALQPVVCSPGEFPGSTCKLTDSQLFMLTGEFYESQRSGRILVGIVHGRVMLDTLSHVEVRVESIQADNETTAQAVSPSPRPRTFRFAVRTGNAQHSIMPHQQFLTEIDPAYGIHSPHVFLEEDPSSFLVCCNVTVMKKNMNLGRIFAHNFTLKRIQIAWNDDLSISEIDIMDPRLHLEFDRSLMRFDPSPEASWEILDTGDWGQESATTIKVTYTHPGTLGRLTAFIFVTLAQVKDIIFEPEVLEFRRIHCSPSIFQSDCVTPLAVLSHGLGEIELKPGDALSFRTDLPNVTTASLSTLFGLQICVSAIAPGVSRIEVSLSNQIFKTFQATVLDESVVFSRLFLPKTLHISSCRGGAAVLPVVGYTPDGTVMQELRRFGAYVSDAPTHLVKITPSSLYVSVLQATRWGQPDDTITVTLPACEQQSALSITSSILVRVVPCIGSNRLADLTTRVFEDHVELSLAGIQIDSFFVHVRVHRASSSVAYEWSALNPTDDLRMDCNVLQAADHADVLIAGNRLVRIEGGLTENTTPLISLSPRPDVLWGFVEVYAMGKIERTPVDAGRMGWLEVRDTIHTLMPTLPVVDASGLHRSDPVLHGADPLFLLTDRHRLVDIETYSNDRELSIMFRVANRFLVPDVDTCTITCTVMDATGTLPLLPGATRQKSGDQTVTATPMRDGWYAIQTDGATPIPQLCLFLKTITVETATSYKPWQLIVDEKDRTLHTGTILHDCPRTATDKARFMIAIRVPPQPGPPSPNLINALACDLHVVARRIAFGIEGGTTTWSTLSVSVESFVRVRQIRERVLNPSFLAILDTFAVPGNNSSFLMRKSPFQTSADQVAEVERILYVEDKSDGNISCPPGMFFSRNGTYQKLPEHAQAGVDCYGMVCNSGYRNSTDSVSGLTTCVPESVPPDIAWICVTVILSLLGFVVCLICCVKLSRTVLPQDRSADSLPAPLAGIAVAGQENEDFAMSRDDENVHPVFDARRWGSISEVILDDHSLMMLEGEFSPAPRDESRRHTN